MGMGSDARLDDLFVTSGAVGPPPDLADDARWGSWLFQIGMDPNTDSLAVLGGILEELMDVPPQDATEADQREQIIIELEWCGFRYFRGGRVLPKRETHRDRPRGAESIVQPNTPEDLLRVTLGGLRRAMHPLTHRRKDAVSFSFNSEHDVQDLLHSLLRPWVDNIRPVEFTPSYAGTRMDFLLPAHFLVIEIKFVRDRLHGSQIGHELIIDIEHYRRRLECQYLWCAIYKPHNFLQNAEGLRRDLEGKRSMPDGQLTTKLVFI